MDRCAVCGDKSKTKLKLCSECRRPCHSKCSGKKKELPCDICRGEKQRQTTAKAPKSIVKPKSAQVSTRASFSRRRASNASIITTSHQHAPLGSSTPAATLSSRISSACASRTLCDTTAQSAGLAAGARGPGAPERGAEQVNCLQALEPTLSDSARRVNTTQTPSIAYSNVGEEKVDDGSTTVNASIVRSPAAIQVLPPPLGGVNLDGVTNVLMPVSTLEFFFSEV